MLLNLTKPKQFEDLISGLLISQNLKDEVRKIAVDFIREFEEFCLESFGTKDVEVIHQIVLQGWENHHLSLVSNIK